MELRTIICGDAETELKKLPANSINCCISSPPYWALRDYGTATWEGGDPDCSHEVGRFKYPASDKQKSNTGSAGHQARDICPHCGAKRIDNQLGLEPTFEEYIDKLCTIYDEVKRVLRPDGTCWVNLGDTYGGLKVGNTETRKYKGAVTNSFTKSGGVEKCLCLIPDRFRIEMVNRGWILRNRIIWAKPNPMPSSAKDRFTVDYEDVMFFVKNKRYWFEPQYEPYASPEGATDSSICGFREVPPGQSQHGSLGKPRSAFYTALGRNKRCVWTIPTQPFPEAHFATFPEKLVEPMIKAGCPEFICAKCGKARVKILQDVGEKTWTDTRKQQSKDSFNVGIKGLAFGRSPQIEFKGYTDCGCGAEWRPGVCLDMFRRFGNCRRCSCTIKKGLHPYGLAA